MSTRFSGLVYVGRVSAPRQTYFVYKKSKKFIVISYNLRLPEEGYFQIFKKSAINRLQREFKCRKVTVDLLKKKKVVKRTLFKGLYGFKLHFRIMAALYILCSLGAAAYRKIGKRLLFEIS